MKTLSTVRPLRTEADYQEALAAIEPFFRNEPEAGTPEADHYDLLALVIEKYEDEHHPVAAPSPVDFVLNVMEFRGFTRRDLIEVIGSASRVSEFLKGKRDLTTDQMRRLRDAWGVSADALLGPARELAAA